LDVIRGLADEIICLEVPEDFYAVGQYFKEFAQVPDDEVVAILKEIRSKPPILK
jgi:predicted phosphoribosyltransferase